MSSCSSLSTRSPEMHVNVLIKSKKSFEERTCVVNWRGQWKGLTSWTCPCGIGTSILSHRRWNTVSRRTSNDSGMSTARSTNCSNGWSQLLQFGYRCDFYLQATISNSWAIPNSMGNITRCAWKKVKSQSFQTNTSLSNVNYLSTYHNKDKCICVERGMWLYRVRLWGYASSSNVRPRRYSCKIRKSRTCILVDVSFHPFG